VTKKKKWFFSQFEQGFFFWPYLMIFKVEQRVRLRQKMKKSFVQIAIFRKFRV